MERLRADRRMSTFCFSEASLLLSCYEGRVEQLDGTGAVGRLGRRLPRAPDWFLRTTRGTPTFWFPSARPFSVAQQPAPDFRG